MARRIILLGRGALDPEAVADLLLGDCTRCLRRDLYAEFTRRVDPEIVIDLRTLDIFEVEKILRPLGLTQLLTFGSRTDRRGERRHLHSGSGRGSGSHLLGRTCRDPVELICIVKPGGDIVILIRLTAKLCLAVLVQPHKGHRDREGITLTVLGQHTDLVAFLETIDEAFGVLLRTGQGRRRRLQVAGQDFLVA